MYRSITVEAFNRACHYVADVAYQKRLANKIAIPPMVYNTLRERFGLSSQMAVRAISKAIEAYKRDKRVHVRFDPHGAMIFDERIMSFKGLTHVSLLALTKGVPGRLRIPLRFGEYQASRLDRRKGQADLVLRNGVFYLDVCINLPEPPPADTSGGVLGVDLGIVEIASDSEGNQYSGSQVKQVRRNLRKARQSFRGGKPTPPRNDFASCRADNLALFVTSTISCRKRSFRQLLRPKRQSLWNP